MAEKSDPTKAPEFKRVLGNLLSTPHKPQSELKGTRRPERMTGRPKAEPSKAKPAR